MDVECSDWREAVRESAQCLLTMGYITPGYVEAILENIEHNGPYIVLSRGFALPHGEKVGVGLVLAADIYHKAAAVMKKHGEKIIHFDGHMDTVRVDNPEEWQQDPFGGKIVDGWLWGRGSVDMKSALCSSVYGAARARELGYTEGKTIYVTGTVCEEYCDGENLKHLYAELGLRPDYCIICEPCDNVITLGHKGKAQIRIRTHAPGGYEPDLSGHCGKVAGKGGGRMRAV